MKPELQSASPFTRPGDGTVTLKSVWRAFAATALFRIWEAVLFLSLWSTAVVLIHNFVWDGLQTESTLLTGQDLNELELKLILTILNIV